MILFTIDDVGDNICKVFDKLVCCSIMILLVRIFAVNVVLVLLLFIEFIFIPVFH